ncbi:MAG TPA: DNA replication/repair protein RecF [Bacilli bacterium]|nr:DNA replication/repair protein RecF [Bacilli bacterium]
MIISELELLNFRNHKNVNVIFTSGLNVIVGENGIGKTNIVEAIDFLGFAKSFRTNESLPLIKEGEQKAIINAQVHTPSRTHIEIEVMPRHKVVRVNNKTVGRLSALSKYVRVTTFQPADVFFFDESPQNRRRFIDTTLAKSDEDYLATLINYERLLKERNAALKLENNDDVISVIDEPFVQNALELVKRREKFVRELSRVVNETLQKLTNEKLYVQLSYKATLGAGGTTPQSALGTIKRNREREKVLQTTTVGPHRDDLNATLNGKTVKTHASQGQKRMIAIALKLAPYFMEKQEHRRPIIVLDDVLSELDETHRERLLTLLLACQQVFVTATEYTNHAHSIYEIDRAGIKRRTST